MSEVIKKYFDWRAVSILVAIVVFFVCAIIHPVLFLVLLIVMFCGLILAFLGVMYLSIWSGFNEGKDTKEQKEENKEMKWNKYTEDSYPEIGKEVIAYNSKWVDADFNPRGQRVGFRTEDGFVSAFWWDYQDDYIGISKLACEADDNSKQFFANHRDNTEPEYWIEMPVFNATEVEGLI